MAKTKADKPKKQRFKWVGQLRQSYQMTRKVDTRIGWILLAWILGVGAVAYGVFSLVPGPWYLDAVTALLTGLLAGLIVFGRRAERAAYHQMEGQPGAAVAVLGMLKRGWKVDQIVAFTKQQDLVHRVVGPPGIVLVGEGNKTRLKQLLASERRKHERVASEVTIHEVIVGRGEGEVPLPKLRKHVAKKKRTLKPAQMTDVLARLKALDAQRSPIPIPKGPVPTSMKGYRGNLRGR